MESRSFRGIGDVLILPPHSFDIGCCCRLGEVEVEVEVVGRRESRGSQRVSLGKINMAGIFRKWREDMGNGGKT